MQYLKTKNIPKRGFENAEFEERVSKAQKILYQWNLDGIILTSPPNIRYFTGFDSQFWESPTRPWFVVVPLEGKPAAVIPEIGEPEMNLTWIDDIRTWSAPKPEDDGISLLRLTLEELSKSFGSCSPKNIGNWARHSTTRSLYKTFF